MPCQYGELPLLLNYTKGKRNGYVVDVGAADPVVNSNSHDLIADYGWSALLIDPLPDHASKLRAEYADNPAVLVAEMAVSDTPGTISLWPGEQGTTALTTWRDRMSEHYGTKYGEPIEVEARTLAAILLAHNAPPIIDFLTIDCEGMDLNVLCSLDWDRYRVDLCCVECRPTWTSLMEFMAGRGLNIVGVTNGNTLFGRTQ